MAVILAAAMWGVAPASAATISLQPSVGNHDVGDIFSVNIVVEGLADDESVAVAALWLSFGDIVTGVSYTPDPGDLDGDNMGLTGCLDCDLSFGFAPFDPMFGIPDDVDLDLFIAAPLPLGMDHDALKAKQGASFVIAKIFLEAVSPGITTLALSNVSLSNVEGQLIDTEVEDAVVCVNRPQACAIIAPEPGSLALFGLGAVAVAATRRRRSRS